MEQILWIDDGSIKDVDIFLFQHLQKEGFRVSRVRSEEAVEVLLPDENGEEVFSLVFLPVDKETYEGIELIEELRAKGVKAPIFAYTCRSYRGIADIAARALNAGADDCQSCPFNKDEWTERIRALIRRGELHERIINFGRMKVFIESKAVTVDGKCLYFTEKEAGIIFVLANRLGRCYSKESILDRLYYGPDAPESKIIDVFICKIREKIANALGIQNNIDTMIRTVWGKGYEMLSPDQWAERTAEQEAEQVERVA